MAKVTLTIEGESASDVMREIKSLAEAAVDTGADVRGAPAADNTKRRGAGKSNTAENPTSAGPSATGATGAQSSPSATAALGATGQAVDVFGGAQPAGAATPAAQPAAASAEPVDVNKLKDAMTNLLKKKSAAFAQQVFRDNSGYGSITELTKNSQEQTLYRKVYDAMIAAAA